MTDLVNDQQSDQRQMIWRSLARKSDFQMVYEQGAKRVGRLVVVYLLAPEGDQAAGPGVKPDLARAVVASKKVGNAVARARAKRLMREARRLGVLGEPDQLRWICERFLREPGGRAFLNENEKSNKSSDSAGEKASDTAADEMAAAANETNTFAGLWVVLVARRKILGASSREVREELDALLKSGP